MTPPINPPAPDPTPQPSPWVGLTVGNSHLHWAQFEGDRLLRTWQGEPLSGPLQHLEAEGPLYFASVVPAQTAHLRAYAQAHEVTLKDIPLANLYATLGIDRALALLGAGDRQGYPVLVIDGGTAITLTGADGDRALVGGAILPGLQLQLDSLAQGTAALPQQWVSDINAEPGHSLPERWALGTPGAIASGICHSVASGLRDYVSDWLARYPTSAVVVTGGSGPWMAAQLTAAPTRTSPARISWVPELGAVGWRAWWQQTQGR